MIKKLIEYLGRLTNDKSIAGFIIKRLFKDSKFLSLNSLVSINATERPEYTYCVYNAAKLAKKLNYKAISLIEFGVAEGNGIKALEKIATRIEFELDIKIQIYGFDRESGLSEPQDYTDLPYFFKAGLYRMDKNKLEKNLKYTKLVIGDVKDTVKSFFTKFNPAPIGAIFNDLDYCSSTIDSFGIFEGNSNFFLPRVFCYYDDVVGSENEMYGEYTGELLAINNFNQKNKNKKVFLNKNLVALSNQSWRYQIYYFHDFLHPKYNHYIGNEEQKKIYKSIKLK